MTKRISTLVTILFLAVGFATNAQVAPGSIAPDFTTTDINGVEHHLYETLAEGKSVVLHFFDAGSETNWQYWNYYAVQSLFVNYGPGGTNTVDVLSIESNPLTGDDDLLGMGIYSSNNWVSSAYQPIVDDASLSMLYGVTITPMVIIICPDSTVAIMDPNWPTEDNMIAELGGCGSTEVFDNVSLYTPAITGICDGGALSVVLYNGGYEPLVNPVLEISYNGVVSSFTYEGIIEQWYSVYLDLGALPEGPVDIVITYIGEDDYPLDNSVTLTYNPIIPFESTSHVHVDLTTDEYPSDVTWTISDHNGAIVASGGPYFEPFVTYSSDVFLADLGCYTFDLYDDSDNGVDTEEIVLFTSVDDWGDANLFEYDGTYEYGAMHVPFVVVEEVPVAITGFVFEDLNGNGFKEWDEPGIGSVEVHLGDLVTISNDNGSYAFNDVVGDYSSLYIVYDNIAWPIATTPVYYDLSMSSSTSFNFGLNNGAPVYDVMIWYADQTYFVCNQEASLFATVINNGNTAVDITASVTIGPEFVFIGSSPEPVSVVDNVITWSFDDLAAGAVEFLEIYVQSPGEELLGTIVETTASFTAYDNDMNVVDSGTFTAASEFYCSFDPNDISVDPRGETDEHFIQNGTALEYTIRFQNIGNYPAQNVVVVNQLDPNLEYGTFELLGTSHAGQLTYNEVTGELTFSFYDIYLPSVETDEAASHGFIQYRVIPDAFLNDGTVINNNASIIFDENAPIVTNTVFNTINDLFFGIEEISAGRVSIYPNPASEIVTVNVSGLQGKVQMQILDAAGRIVADNNLTMSRTQLNVAALAKGFYTLRVISNDGSSAESKLVIR